MPDFFNAMDRPDLGGVTLARIADPGTVSQGDAVFLETDPTGGSWLPVPAYIKAKTGVTLDSKLCYLIPYTKPVFTAPFTPDMTVNTGGDAAWQVSAAGGAAPLVYAWYYATTPTGAGTLIDPLVNPSAAKATLENHAVDDTSEGYYWATVADANSVTLTTPRSHLTVV